MSPDFLPLPQLHSSDTQPLLGDSACCANGGRGGGLGWKSKARYTLSPGKSCYSLSLLLLHGSATSSMA